MFSGNTVLVLLQASFPFGMKVGLKSPGCDESSKRGGAKLSKKY